jgi:ABC-type sugar transport system substrate-binding protein
VIYAENDGMAQGAVQALDAAGITHGKNGKVKILGFDFNRFALRNVQAGYWDCDVQCSPRQAGEISRWIKDAAAGKALRPASCIRRKSSRTPRRSPTTSSRTSALTPIPERA